MFIELLDSLRCPNPHDDTWLVASFEVVSNRFVEKGSLGCPICQAKYPIENGIADFRAGRVSPSCDAERAAADHGREELATRVGAFLDVTEPGATVLLGGVWAYAAAELSEMAGVKVLAPNPGPGVSETPAVGLVHVAADIPVAPGSCLGAALDAWFNTAIVGSAIRAVRPGGRIVGPTLMLPPEELSVLAQDADYWVAQKSPDVIPLRRASR